MVIDHVGACAGRMPSSLIGLIGLIGLPVCMFPCEFAVLRVRSCSMVVCNVVVVAVAAGVVDVVEIRFVVKFPIFCRVTRISVDGVVFPAVTAVVVVKNAGGIGFLRRSRSDDVLGPEKDALDVCSGTPKRLPPLDLRSVPPAARFPCWPVLPVALFLGTIFSDAT